MKGVKSLNRDFQLNENVSVNIRYADDTTLMYSKICNHIHWNLNKLVKNGV